MSDYFDNLRRAWAENIQERKEKLQRRKLSSYKETEHDAAEAAQLQDEEARLDLPFPAPNVCSQCWIKHGVERPMTPMPTELRGRDRWTCSECGYSVLLAH